MDFLRNLIPLLAFWCAWTAVGRAQSAPASAMIEEFAGQALVHCDASRSRYLSDALTKKSPELGALYRLAWISLLSQSGKASTRPSWNAPLSLDEKSLAWRASSEVWKDEWKGLSLSKQCQPTSQGFIPSEEEARLIKEVLAPWTKPDAAVPLPLEESILTLAYNEWLAGVDLSHGAVTKESALSCQWRARDFVRAKTISEDEMNLWQKQCSSCQGRFCFVVKLQLADQQVANQEFRAALASYVDLAHAIDDIPSTLAYRVTALQLMAGKPVENLLRSSAPLFADDSEDVPSVQRETIRSGICERLAGEKASLTKGAFLQVYPKKDVMRQLRTWLLACEIGQSEIIGRKIISTGLGGAEKEMITQSLLMRNSKEKLAQQKRSRESQKSASETLQGVAPRTKALPETLKIPLLLPFPEMTYPSGEYRFTTEFLKAVGKN